MVHKKFQEESCLLGNFTLEALVHLLIGGDHKKIGDSEFVPLNFLHVVFSLQSGIVVIVRGLKQCLADRVGKVTNVGDIARQVLQRL